MNNYSEIINSVLPPQAQQRTLCVDGCTYTVFALPYVQLKKPDDGFAFIDSYYIASNRAYFIKKQLVAALADAGFEPVEPQFPYKHFAVAAGLGTALRSTLVANEKFGTRMALEILGARGVYSKEISAELLKSHPLPSPVCEKCGRCVNACPQGCFDSGGFETDKCVRHMQEQACFPDEKSASAAGLNLWGCDICQRVCPFNAAQSTRELTEREKELFSLETLFAAFASGKKGCEPYRDMLGSNYLRPAKLLCVTLNTMANTRDPRRYEAYAQQCLTHADARVRAAAQRLKSKTKVS